MAIFSYTDILIGAAANDGNGTPLRTAAINSLNLPWNSLLTVYTFDTGTLESFFAGNARFAGQTIRFNGNTVIPSSASPGISLEPNGSNMFLVNAQDSTVTSSVQDFRNPNGIVGRIQTSGTTTIYATSSDPRLKTEFRPFDVKEAWDKFDLILAASGCFEFKTDLNKVIWGFDAWKLIDAGIDMGVEGQGLRTSTLGTLIKKAVLDKNGRIIEPEKRVEPSGVDQSKGVPYLVAVIADLRKRLEALEGK